jgi:hypothetical protein
VKKLFALRKMLLFLSLVALPTAGVEAQAPQATAPSGELFRTIASLDRELFDAYNRCDLEKFGSLLADDLEFYHDQTGLSRSRQSTVDAVRSNICGKVHRDLVPGTLEVYPLKGYGAIESGTHLFCDPKLGKCGEGSGTGKFFMLWQNKDGAWKLTRVISYDHCSGCYHAAPPK